MRKRAGALIINDKKLLLISEANHEHYWTPGGGLELGENYIGALKRELKEEIDAELTSAELFFACTDTVANELVHYYLVSLKASPKPPSSTRVIGYSKEDYLRNEIPISKRVYNLVYPRLIRADLV